VRTIQHLKEVQKEAGMLDLRDAANQGKKKQTNKLKHTSGLYSGKVFN